MDGRFLMEKMDSAFLRNGEDVARVDDIAGESVGGFEGVDIDAVVEADAVEVIAALDGVGASGGRGGRGRGRVAGGWGGIAGLGVGGLLLVSVRVIVAWLGGRDADVIVIGLVGALFGLAVWVGAVAVSVGIGVLIGAGLFTALAGNGGNGENAGEGGQGNGRDFHDQTRAPVNGGI